MVKKGLSLEEKRGKILNIYHGTKSIFSLKEIEKAATKQGVVSQTVKVSGRWQPTAAQRLALQTGLNYRRLPCHTVALCVPRFEHGGM